jgi:hypothetical protein
MGNYKGFTDGIGERIELFSIYSDLDEEIIEKASECNLYLIGGTAIEIWLNHLRLKGWRKRSLNDFDFIINEASSNQLNRFRKFLKSKGFKIIGNLRLKRDKITIDFFDYGNSNYEFDENLLRPDMLKTENSIKLMSPIFLFSSKFIRVRLINSIKIKNEIQNDRYKKDLKDLKDLLLIIKKSKLEKKLNEALEYFYGEYESLDKIKIAEEFINKELK